MTPVPDMTFGGETKYMEFSPGQFTFTPSESNEPIDRVVRFRAGVSNLGDALNSYPTTRVKIAIQGFNNA